MEKRRNNENKGFSKEVYGATVYKNMSQEGKKIIFGRVGMAYDFPKKKCSPVWNSEKSALKRCV